MLSEQERIVQTQIRQLFDAGAITGLTDGQLLERSTTLRGEVAETAFSGLLERHGPMVLGACRKILQDDREAEDALQATFLVLFFKGDSLWVRDSLGPWLHRVACRIALRARLAASRRRDAERVAAEVARNRTRTEGPDLLGQALHEEIDRLPEYFRVPVVLCDLEGRSYEEAARHVGCPVGTIKSRLARGRLRLRERLTRRGLEPSSGLVAAGPGFDAARSSVPAMLFDSVVRNAMRVASSNMPAGAVPATIATLAERMLTNMRRAMLARCAWAMIGVGVLSVGFSALVQRTAGAPPQDAGKDRLSKPLPPVSNEKGPVAKGRAAGEIIARVANLARGVANDEGIRLVAIDPETAAWRTIARNLPYGPISPDGRFLVYSQLGRDHDESEMGIWIYDTTGELPPRRIFERNGVPHWSHDGRDVVIGVRLDAEKFETWRVRADGNVRTRLPIPEADLVLDCSRDGTWLATRTVGGDPAHHGRLTLVHPDGNGARHLTEGSAKGDRFTIFKISPDGRSIAYVEVKTENKVRNCRLYVMDLDGQHRREIPARFQPGSTVSVYWSPDGSRLALNVMDDRTKEGAVALVNADGTGFRTLELPPGKWNLLIGDWTILVPGVRVGDLVELRKADAKSPRGRYQALLKEVRKAKTFEPRRYVDQFLEIAESAPQDRAAVDAWIWIVTAGFDGSAYWRAIDRLTEQAETVKVGHAAMALANSVSPSAETLLRAVIAKNESRDVRGYACVSLGQFLKGQSERLRQAKDDPDSAARWEAIFLAEGSTKEGFDRFIAGDPDALMQEAETVFERVLAEFGDVPRDDRTLGDEARAELDEIQNLRPGKPAPEITGKDTDGKALTLSEFRGKVVVLTFWADWCGACRGIYPDEIALVASMSGRPFVLLGVNGDADLGKLGEVIAKAGITWRSWSDGGGSPNTPGPIASRYNVHGWPTLYVLDHRGVIRHKYLDFPGTMRLNAVVEALVKDAERDAGGE